MFCSFTRKSEFHYSFLQAVFPHNVLQLATLKYPQRNMSIILLQFCVLHFVQGSIMLATRDANLR